MIAIDLGSNTLRVLEYDCATKKELFSYEKVVKTADDLASSGQINDDAVLRIVSAINEVKELLDFSSKQIKAVTTEALRRASNANEVLAKIKKETAICFDVISGDEEAELTLLAVKNRLKKLHYYSDSFALIDIGGGSTEIIFHFKGKVVSRSFPIGIVTFAQSYDSLEYIKEVLPSKMLDMQMFCAQIYATMQKPDSFVATAGTPTTVAAMKLGFNYETYDAKKINGTILQKNELDFYLKKLLSMPFEEREIAVGTGRSDLIAAGILIYKQLYTILEFENCVVIDDGLREGVALNYCEQ